MLFIIEITESAILEIRVDCLMQKQTCPGSYSENGRPQTSKFQLFFLFVANV